MKARNSKQSVRRARVSKGATIAQQQQALRDEFCAAYGLAPEQISFKGSADPIFDFDATNILVNTLARIPDIDVGLEKFHEGRVRIAESFCRMKVNGCMTRKFFGVGIIGEQMHDGTIISTEIQAVNVSRARALRCGCRAVGFDPVKFHQARKEGRIINLLGSEDEAEAKMRAEIHVLAGPQGLNFIKRDGDRAEYENLIAAYFNGRTSSKDLEPDEKAKWLGMLRDWARKDRAA